MITVAIPAYNSEKTIAQAIVSALSQDYDDVEILVIDNASTDRTTRIAAHHPVRLMRNSRNIGYAKNMEKCLFHASGRCIIFLCADDKFTSRHVLSDVIAIFDACPNVGVIDRGYYQYMDGIPGAVVEVRESNVLLSSVNPSGIALRRPCELNLSDKAYIEFPTLVKQMLENCEYKRLPYDSIAARLHKDNLATTKSYYRGSIARNMLELTGRMDWNFKNGYIPIKNRAGNFILLKEIIENVKMSPHILVRPDFWFFALFSLLTPAFMLRDLSGIYRNRIGRMFSKIVHRKCGPIVLNLGAGERGGHETINIDITDYNNIDRCVDLACYPWPFENESVDGIYAHHVIEHMPNQEDFIIECIRILKPGGFLHLTVPHSSCVTSVGCMGHNRTYSYSTFKDYLSKDFYMFGHTRFRTVEQKLNWWYDIMADNVPWYLRIIIIPMNTIINFLIKLSPRIFENGWCYWVGGAREVVWMGEKI